MGNPVSNSIKTRRLRRCERKGDNNLNQNNQKAIKYYEKALKKAGKLQDKIGERRLQQKLAKAYYKNEQYESVIDCCETLIISNEGEDEDAQLEPEVFEMIFDSCEKILSNLHSSNYSWVKRYYEKGIKIAQQQGKRKKAKSMLENLGYVNLSNKRYSDAIECYKQALTIPESLEERNEENRLGYPYNQNNENEKEIECCRQALNTCQQLNDKVGERKFLELSGHAYVSAGDFVTAIECYKQSLQIAQELDDKIRLQDYLGNAYQYLQQYENAMECFDECMRTAYSDRDYDNAIKYGKKALDTVQITRDKDGERKLRSCIGHIYYHDGQNKKAIEQYQEATLIVQQLDDVDGEMELHEWMGHVYREMNQYDEAFEHYEQVLVTAYDQGNFEKVMELHEWMGHVYREMNQYDEAFEHYEQVLVTAYDQGNFEKVIKYSEIVLKVARNVHCSKDKELRIHKVTGHSYYQKEQYEMATKCYEKALDIAETFANRYVCARLLECLGFAWLQRQQYEKTKKFLKNVHIEDKAIYECSGKSYFCNKKYRKAIECYDEALEIARQSKDKDGEKTVLVLSGHTYYINQEYVKAAKQYENALKITGNARDKTVEKRLHEWSGNAYYDDKQYKKSIECFKKARAITQQVNNKDDEIEMLRCLGDAYHKDEQGSVALQCYESLLEIALIEQKYEKVIEYSKKAVQIAQDILDTKGERRMQKYLGDGYFNSGHYEKALKCYENVVDRSHYEMLAQRIGDCAAKAIETAQKLLDLDGECTIRETIGNIYRKTNQFKESIDSYKKLLEIAQQREDKVKERTAHMHLTEAYIQLKDYKMAAQCSKRFQENVQEPDYYKQELTAKEHLGQVYEQIGKDENAIKNYENALKTAHAFCKFDIIGLRRLKERLINSSERLGKFYHGSEKYEKATEYYEKAINIAREIECKDRERILHELSACAYNASKKHGEVIECYEKALKIAQDVNDKKEEKRLKECCGNACYNAKQFVKAIHYHEKALIMAQEVEDKKGEIRLKGYLGNAYFSNRQYKNALSCYEAARLIAHENERYDEVTEFSDKALKATKVIHEKRREHELYGDAFYNDKQYKKAIDHYTQAIEISANMGQIEILAEWTKKLLEIFHQHPNADWLVTVPMQAMLGKDCFSIIQDSKHKHGEQEILETLGDVHQIIGNYETAVEYYKRVLEIKKKFEDNLQETKLNESVGKAYKNSGYEKASDCHLKATKIARDTPIKSREEDVTKIDCGRIFEKIGNAYLCDFLYQKAEEYHQKALKKVNDQEKQRQVCVRLANLYASKAINDKAVEFYKKACSIAKEIKHTDGEFWAHKGAAESYYQSKLYDKAITHYKEALEIAQNCSYKDEQRRINERLGQLHLESYHYALAIEFLKKALNFAEKFGTDEGEEKLLVHLGDAHYGNEEFAKAVEYYEKAVEIAQKPIEERRIHERRAQCYFEDGKYKKVIECCVTVLPFKQKDENEDGRFPELLGDSYDKTGDHESARQSYHNALLIAEKYGDKDREARLNRKLGEIFLENRRYEQAQACFEKSLEVFRKRGDQTEARKLYYSLEKLYLKKGIGEKAADYRKKGEMISPELAEKCKERRAQEELGSIYYNNQQHEKAIECFTNAQQIAEELGQKEDERRLFERLGEVYHGNKQSKMEIKSLQKALTIAGRLEQKDTKLRILISIGAAYTRDGRHRNAINSLLKAVKIAGKVRNAEYKGEALATLGVCYNAIGRYNEAICSLYEARKNTSPTEDKHKEQNICINLAVACINSGENGKAIKHLHEALAICQNLGHTSKPSEGDALQQLGDVYCKKGKYKDASECYLKALKIANESQNEISQLNSLRNLGDVYRRIGHVREGVKFCNQALQIAQKTKNKRSEGVVFYFLGLAYSKLASKAKNEHDKECSLRWEKEGVCKVSYERIGQGKQTIKKLNNFSEIVRELENEDGEVRVYKDLGHVYKQIRLHGEAIEFYHKALMIAKKRVSLKREEMFVYLHLGLTYHLNKQRENATEYLKQCVTLAKQLAENKDEEEVRRILHGSNDTKHNEMDCRKLESNFQKHAGIFSGLSEMEKHNSSERWCIEKACQFFCRSILAQDEVRGQVVKSDEINISMSNMFFHRHTYLMNSLLDLNREKAALLVLDIGKAKALQNLMAFRASVEENNAKWIKTISENPSAPKNDSLLDDANSTVIRSIQDGTILVYGFDNLDILHTWVVSSKGVFHKQCDKQKGLSMTTYLEACITLVRDSSRKSLGASNLKRVQDLYGLDFTVATWPKDKFLCILISSKLQANEIGDACTRYGLDTTLGKNRQHLNNSMKNCAIFDRCLTKLYSDLIAPVQEHFSGNKLVIVPHGPLFTLPFAALKDRNNMYLGERYSMQVTPSLHTLDLSLARQPAVLGPALFVGNPTVDIPESSFDFNLPCAETEANECGTYFGSTALTREKATKKKVLERMKEASIIHIAAHGHEEYKAIFLASSTKRRGTLPPDVGHYLLKAGDITECTLNARLVVLSCCFSGRGQISAEGVVGIARSFLGAGARSVLAALWQLNDSATLEIMKMFYQYILKEYSVCNSLQQTMTAMKEQYNVREWATFQILGEDSIFTKEDIGEIRRKSR